MIIVMVIKRDGEPVQSAGHVVLDEHVRLPDQALDDGLAVGLSEVHAHAALVPVQRDEVQAERVGGGRAADVHERRPVTAAVVADAGPLHFDHVRAHVGQDHRAIRTGRHSRHVDHADAVQRSRRRRRRRQRPSRDRRPAEQHHDGHVFSRSDTNAFANSHVAVNATVLTTKYRFSLARIMSVFYAINNNDRVYGSCRIATTVLARRFRDSARRSPLPVHTTHAIVIPNVLFDSVVI